ncbi:MAG: hypothetical protein MR555_00555 [Spirochaetia bacterium]|nr:hypothetical protein [Spirochaetia bacterium]
MKKFVKVVLSSFVVFSLSLCSLSAKELKKGPEDENVKEVLSSDVKKGPEKRGRREGPCKREIFSIGQVTEITSDSISFKDADENEKSVKITPFTRIEKRKDNSDSEKKFEKLSVSDIKKGDWLIVSVFETDTKSKIASRILVED